MQFFHAHLDSPSFSFDGYGETPEDASASLMQALRLHGKEYKLRASWYFKFLPDAVVTVVRTNEPYRDDAPLLRGRFGHAPDGTGRILRTGRVVWD